MEQAQGHPILEGGETVFSVAGTNLKFGLGALSELGEDARRLGMRRVALFTDRNVAATESFEAARRSLERAGVDAVVYDEVAVEPTDASFEAAAAFAGDGWFDGFVSLGGGSVIDTAKAADLLVSHPDELLAYVNAPLGGAKPVPGPLKPHIACPTTSGTGSECTSVAVFDLVERKVKTGIASPHLKPSLAIVDPATTWTLPAGVVAATGFDVLTHAIESYTARAFASRPKPASPGERPPYQGANPWSDMGSLQAIRLGGRYLERAATDADDREARTQLMFAATLAGLAFGNAGVHVPHAMSYSVAGLNHSFKAAGYEGEQGMVPHGISVVVNAPAAFRFTAEVAPRRHLDAAVALGVDGRGTNPHDSGELLAGRLIEMMRATGIPNGLGGLGYSERDVAALAEGALAQQRLLVIAPRPVERGDLEELYRQAMRYW